MNRLTRLAAAVVVTALLALPSFAQRGKADFTTYVALGDSYGAGVSSVGLNINHQRYSWPAQIARQAGLNTDCPTDGPRCFQIPYISYPGILPELRLLSLQPLSIALEPGAGAPLRSGLPRPYNNMSIDGAEVADMLGVSGDGNEGINGPIIHRKLGSPVDQVLSLKPTFITMWIGGNDLLRAGGIPAGATPVEAFRRDYNAVLDRLVQGAPNAGIVVGTLPTNAVRTLPYVNTIPAVLLNPATNQPVLDPAGRPIPLIGDLGGGVIAPLPAGSRVLLPAADAIRSGFGIPAVLAPLVGNLPNIGKPLPNELVITPAEAVVFEQLLVDYNGVIKAAAAQRNIPVADIDGLFKRFEQGLTVGPVRLSLAYITGGLVSLDGYHLTDIGYMLFANEFIRTINRAYGTRVPLGGIWQFYANNGAFFPDSGPASSITIDRAAADQLREMLFPAAPVATKKRSARH